MGDFGKSSSQRLLADDRILDLQIAPGYSTIDGANHGSYLALDTRPACRGQNDDCDTPRTQVLLDAHSGGSQRAPRRVFEHGASLLQRDGGKPLNELVNVRAILEVLEQRGNRHACAAEHPRSADQFGVPLDGGAGGPVDHESKHSSARKAGELPGPREPYPTSTT